MNKIILSLSFVFLAFTAQAAPPAQVPFTTAQTAPWKTCTLENYDACFTDKVQAMHAFRILPENPRPVAVLLMHGLSDSPYIMKDAARIFAEQGFPVVSIRLSGMGTQKEALHLVQHEQWLEDVRYGFAEARKLAPKVILSGFSMGGYLSAHMAEELQQQHRESELAGLAFFSPAFKVIPFADYYACSSAWLNPSSYVSDSIFPGGGEDMRYMQMSNHGLCEFSKLYLNDNLIASAKTLTVPMFVVLSEADSAIDKDMVWNYTKTYAGPKEMVYFDTSANKPSQPWIKKTRVAQPLDHSWVMLKPASNLLTGQVNADFASVEEGLHSFIEKIQ